MESISEHKKTTLAQSDKGSWFDQVNWLEEEESNASVSARKLCSEIDSEDRTEKRNNIVVDVNLLNGAIERSLVYKSCQCPVFCEELEERSGQGVRLGFVCMNANCSLFQMPFNSSSKWGKLFDINRASTLAFGFCKINSIDYTVTLLSDFCSMYITIRNWDWKEMSYFIKIISAKNVFSCLFLSCR